MIKSLRCYGFAAMLESLATRQPHTSTTICEATSVRICPLSDINRVIQSLTLKQFGNTIECRHRQNSI